MDNDAEEMLSDTSSFSSNEPRFLSSIEGDWPTKRTWELSDFLYDWLPVPGNNWLLPTILFFFSVHYIFGDFLWSFVSLAVATVFSWTLLLIIIVLNVAEYQRMWTHNPVVYGIVIAPAFGSLAIFLAYYVVELFSFDYAVDGGSSGNASVGTLVIEVLLYGCILLWPSQHFVAFIILIVGPFYILGISAVNGATASHYYVTWAAIDVFCAALFLTNFGWRSERRRYKDWQLERFKDDYIFTVRGTYIFNASVAMSFFFLFFSFLWLIL